MCNTAFVSNIFSLIPGIQENIMKNVLKPTVCTRKFYSINIIVPGTKYGSTVLVLIVPAAEKYQALLFVGYSGSFNTAM